MIQAVQEPARRLELVRLLIKRLVLAWAPGLYKADAGRGGAEEWDRVS